MARRTFEDAVRETDRYRTELESLREEARAAARAEVQSSALKRERLEALVRELVTRELRAQRGPWWWFGARDAGDAWLRLLAAAGIVVVLVGTGVFAGAKLFAPEPAPVAATTDAQAPADASETTAPTPATPEALAARFDSLFQARDALLAPLVAEVESLTTADPVRAAAAAWRTNAALNPAQVERLGSALAQAALNRFIAPADAPLTLDGMIRRSPCAGASCDALLAAWRSPPLNAPLPAYDPAAGEDVLRVVERVLVMTHASSQ